MCLSVRIVPAVVSGPRARHPHPSDTVCQICQGVKRSLRPSRGYIKCSYALNDPLSMKKTEIKADAMHRMNG